MTKQVVKVRGADRVARTMAKASKELERMDDANKDYGELLARTAKDYAPSRTGTLRSSIVVRGQQVVATVRYAVPVEFGSRRRGIAAARFMGRALQGTERDRDKIYQAEAEQITGKIKGA